MLSLRKGTDFVPSDLPKMDLSEKAIMFEVSFGEDVLPLLNPPQKIIFEAPLKGLKDDQLSQLGSISNIGSN